MLDDVSMIVLTPFNITINVCTLRFLPYLSPGQVGRWGWEPVIHLVGYVVHEPLKAMTIVILLELELSSDVSRWVASYRGLPSVVVLFELLIQPYLHDS